MYIFYDWRCVFVMKIDEMQTKWEELTKEKVKELSKDLARNHYQIEMIKDNLNHMYEFYGELKIDAIDKVTRELIDIAVKNALIVNTLNRDEEKIGQKLKNLPATNHEENVAKMTALYQMQNEIIKTKSRFNRFITSMSMLPSVELEFLQEALKSRKKLYAYKLYTSSLSLNAKKAKRYELLGKATQTVIKELKGRIAENSISNER